LAAAWAGLSLAIAAPAFAAGNGVHVDPGSPAGKQYAIPIPAARSMAAGGQGATGSANPPLFGVGVTPGGVAAMTGASSTGARAARSTGGRSNARRRAGAAQTKRAKRSGLGPQAAGVAARDPSSQSNAVGGTSWLPLLGGGALVLLIGGGGGFLLRRSL
ncbi:MAG: hypothetical protein ABI323_00665, partial [Solirubrobacteraceae bacterium]